LSRRANITDVAKLAGVSKQTISRVVNGSEKVSPETRARVEAAIRELDYRPSAVARQLSRGRSFTLGVVGGARGYVNSRAYSAAAVASDALGYALVMKELASRNPEDARMALLALQDQQVEGILWMIPEVANSYAWLEQAGLPELKVPLLFMNVRPRASIRTVGFDHYRAGKLATEHLLSLGRQRIAHISGPEGWWASESRQQAWRDTVQAAAQQPDNACVLAQNWQAAAGYAAFTRLLEQNPRMDALFACNDLVALGAMLKAHEMGIRIPDDIAVIGVDNLPESAFFHPPLTTMEQDAAHLGQAAIEKLVGMVAHRFGETPDADENQSVLLHHSLIVRRSTCGL